MMNILSERLAKAVLFLKENEVIKTYNEVAVKLGIPRSSLSMYMSGVRVPTWDTLLDFCDYYPINFKWIRYGTGEMEGPGLKEAVLERKVRLLEKRIAELEEIIAQGQETAGAGEPLPGTQVSK